MEAFAQLGGSIGLEVPSTTGFREQNATGTLIEEWLQLFLKIVYNASMRDQLKRTLEDALQGNMGAREPVDTTPQYVQRVKRNKRHMGKKFRLNT